MRRVAVACSLALLLSTAPAFAQAAAQPPAAPAPAAPRPPAPFPVGAKIAFVNLQQVAALSSEGKVASAKVQALIQKKQAEAAARQKALAEKQNKLQQGGALLSDAARSALEKEIERDNVEGQRFQQDAQAEINDLNQQLQNEFERKLRPVLEELGREKGLHAMFSLSDAGLAWADPGLDLTMEVVKKLDAMSSGKPAATSKP